MLTGVEIFTRCCEIWVCLCITELCIGISFVDTSHLFPIHIQLIIYIATLSSSWLAWIFIRFTEASYSLCQNIFIYIDDIYLQEISLCKYGKVLSGLRKTQEVILAASLKKSWIDTSKKSEMYSISWKELHELSVDPNTISNNIVEIFLVKIIF